MIAYLAVTAGNEKPTRRLVAAMLRRIWGKAARWSEIDAVVARGPKCPQAGTSNPSSIEETGTSPGPKCPTRVARAANDLVIRQPTVVEEQMLPGVATPSEPVTPLPKPRSVPTDAAQRGYAVRDAVAAVVRDELVGMNVSQWRQRNAKTAREMADAGVTPSEAVQWYRETGCVMLADARTAMNRRRPGVNGNGRHAEPEKVYDDYTGLAAILKRDGITMAQYLERKAAAK